MPERTVRKLSPNQPNLRSRQVEGEAPPAGGDLGGSAWESADRMTTMLFGDSSVGKTTAWVSWPGPVLAMVCSGNQRPGEMKSVNTPEVRRKVRAEAVRKTSDCFGMIERAGKDGYRTIVLDHLTALQTLALSEVLGLEKAVTMKTFGMATLEQFGAASNRCRDIVRDMLDLPCNVVLVAQEAFKTPKDAGLEQGVASTVCVPDLGKGLLSFTRTSIDYVLHMYTRPEMKDKTEEVEGQEVTTKERTGKLLYCVRTRSHDVYKTRIRTPRPELWPDELIITRGGTQLYQHLSSLEKKAGRPSEAAA